MDVKKKIYFLSEKRYETFLANRKKYRIYPNGVDVSKVPVRLRRSRCGDGFYCFPRDDDELLKWLAKPESSLGQSFDEDESNRLEIYGVIVDAEKVTVEKCLQLLERIDRESQFIACSVEEPSLFYAELGKDDATRLKASGGIRIFQQRELIVNHVQLIANFGVGD